MAKVIHIAISETFKSKMKSVNSAESVAGKGIINDRHFKENNEKKSQITLIEIESINHYNKITGTSISPINFRRNIITEGVKLNALLGTTFLIGKIKVKAHDLCRPCKYLQETLDQKKLVKELWNMGGLRCEIINSGTIFVNDEIKY
tara:strand:- start:2081 stop:2521 length:441 start_codon:yes stop_codon:yes gene_type:complete